MREQAVASVFLFINLFIWECIMKKKLLALGLACAALFAGHDAMATDLEITASATIAKPITLSKDIQNYYGTTNGNLSFGNITPSDVTATVMIIPNAGQEWDVNKQQGLGMTGNYGPAFVFISGEPAAECSISCPSDTISLENENDPTKTLSMEVLTYAGSVTLDQSGQTVVPVGGSLTVPSDAALGSYSGTFTVSVDYQ